jgi:hypothetical protein
MNEPLYSPEEQRRSRALKISSGLMVLAGSLMGILAVSGADWLKLAAAVAFVLYGALWWLYGIHAPSHVLRLHAVLAVVILIIGVFSFASVQ